MSYASRYRYHKGSFDSSPGSLQDIHLKPWSCWVAGRIGADLGSPGRVAADTLHNHLRTDPAQYILMTLKIVLVHPMHHSKSVNCITGGSAR